MTGGVVAEAVRRRGVRRPDRDTADVELHAPDAGLGIGRGRRQVDRARGHGSVARPGEADGGSGRVVEVGLDEARHIDRARVLGLAALVTGRSAPDHPESRRGRRLERRDASTPEIAAVNSIDLAVRRIGAVAVAATVDLTLGIDDRRELQARPGHRDLRVRGLDDGQRRAGQRRPHGSGRDGQPDDHALAHDISRAFFLLLEGLVATLTAAAEPARAQGVCRARHPAARRRSGAVRAGCFEGQRPDTAP